MEYDKEKALEIIEKFNLSPKTLMVWKLRGNIPNKYLKADAPVNIIDNSKLEEAERIKEILKTGYFNISRLSEVTNISLDRIFYLKKSKSKMTEDEYLAFKKTINNIRLKLKKIDFEKIRKGVESEEKKFLRLHSNKLLVWNVILNRDDVDKSLRSLRYGSSVNFPVDRLDFIQDCVVVFLLKTQI